ncbi:MAG: protein kinase [Pirellulales bacterium]
MRPQFLGPYQLLSRLGHGGMGAVYEAVEQRSGQTVAIKVLAAHLVDDAGVRGRFQTEIETLKSLKHSGIIQLLAYGEEDGHPYFAMELVRGQALDKILKKGKRFSWEEVVTLASAVTRALKVAHDSGAIHRDLKPANLLVPNEGTLADVKLADFGIAKFFGATGHTVAGNVVGTAEYMAPEQAAGKNVDARSDIYSLGLVLYAMMTGKPPFRASHYTEVMRMQQTKTPPQLTGVIPDLPETVDRLIQKMLEKKPEDRPPSALALGRLLEALHEEVKAETQAREDQDTDLSLDPDNTSLISSPSDVTMGLTTDQPIASDNAHLLSPTKGGTASPAPVMDPTKQGDTTEHKHDAEASDATQVNPGRKTRHISIERERLLHEAREKKQQHREHWIHTGTGVGLLIILLSAGYLLLRPASPDRLFERIETTVAESLEPLDGMKQAERFIDEFIERFPDEPRFESVHVMKQQIQIDRLQKRSKLRQRRNKPPYLRIEREYRKAIAIDNPTEQLVALRSILTMSTQDLEAPIGTKDNDELQADINLWKGLVQLRINQTEELVRVEEMANARNRNSQNNKENNEH